VKTSFNIGQRLALCMPMIAIETSIGAGGQNPNLYTGSAFEFARNRGVVSIGVTAAATGTFCTLQAGADVIAEEFAPPVLTRYPIVPDEMYFTDVVEGGDRLKASVRNPTAGAIVVRSILQLSA